MATVMEVMARLTGDASSMVAAWKKAETAAKTATSRMKASAESAKKVVDQLTIPAAAIAAGGLMAGKHLATMASEAEQNVGAVESVFKRYAGSIKTYSRSAANDVGLSQSSYQQFATVVGSQLKNLGMPMGQVAGGTNDLIKKGADLASMFGGTTSEAVAALSSLLRGERDPIERYGVSMKEADVQAQMAAMGLDKLTGKAAKQAKLTATLAILEKQTADATGNFAKEANTAAGAQQRANARWENAQVQLGEHLLPIMTKFSNILTRVARWVSKNSETVMVLGAVVMSAAGAILAISGAMKVWSVWTGIVTVANNLLGKSMKAIPLFWIVTAIMAFIAVVILAYKKVGWFRKAVDTAWAGIKKAVGATVDWFKNTAWPWMKKVWNGIAAGAKWLWKKAIQPAFEGIGKVFRWLWRNIVQPVFRVIKGAIKTLAGVVGWLWRKVFKPYFKFMGGAIKAFWMLGKGIFKLLIAFVKKVLAPTLRWFWRFVVRPVFNAAGDKIKSFWNKVVRPVFRVLVAFVKKTLGPTFRWLRDKVIKPVMNGVGGRISDVWNKKIKPAFKAMNGFIKKTVPAAFRAGSRGVKKAWEAVKNFAAAPIRFVIDTVINKGIIGAFNWIAKKLGVDTLPKVSMPAGLRKGGGGGGGGGNGTSVSGGPVQVLARGGEVKGHSPNATADNIPLWATAKEYMLRQKSAQSIQRKHPGALDYMNTHGALPPQGAPGSSVYGGIPSFYGWFHSAVNKANAMRIAADGASSSWSIAKAANMWNGLAGVNVHVGGSGGGIPTVRSSVQSSLPFPAIPNWAGYFSGQNIYLNPRAGLGGLTRKTVAAHEIGHALGLPHAMATGAWSIMNYNNMYRHNRVTGADAMALRRIYGPPTDANRRFAAEGPSSGPKFDPFGFLKKKVLGIIDKFKEAMPSAGIFADLAWGMAKKVASGMMTVFDNGGQMKRGMIATHKGAKPDVVFNASQWSILKSLVADGGGGGGMNIEVKVYCGELTEESAARAGRQIGNEVYRAVRKARRGGVYNSKVPSP